MDALLGFLIEYQSRNLSPFLFVCRTWVWYFYSEVVSRGLLNDRKRMLSSSYSCLIYLDDIHYLKYFGEKSLLEDNV